MFRHLPPTAKRVARHTDCLINHEIREMTIEELRTVQASEADAVDKRLQALDEEWDIERILEAKAGAIVLVASALGLRFGGKWCFVTGIIGGLLLHHALQGWCPTLPLLRNLGIRTAEEIGNERVALKMMRKDFENLPKDAREILATAER